MYMPFLITMEKPGIKACRLRPLFEGNGFYGKLSFCGKNNEKDLPPPYNKLLNLHHILKNATI